MHIKVVTLKGSHSQSWVRPLQGRDRLLARYVGRVPDAIEYIPFGEIKDLIMRPITVAVFALKLYPHGKEMNTLSPNEVML